MQRKALEVFSTTTTKMAAADEERAVDSAIETLVLNKYCVVTTLNTAVFRVVTTQYLSQGILGGGLP